MQKYSSRDSEGASGTQKSIAEYSVYFVDKSVNERSAMWKLIRSAHKFSYAMILQEHSDTQRSIAEYILYFTVALEGE
jgi:hypothetical protein